MPVIANRLSEQAEYKTELDKLKSIRSEIEDIQKNVLPQKEQEIERLKRANMENEDVTWQDVEEAKQEAERLHYKVQYLESQARDQEKAVNREKEKARRAINEAARQKKLEALKKSIAGYEMVMAAHEEYNAINREQAQALQIAPGEFYSNRRNANIGQRVPHPFREAVNDLWYKQAKEYLKNVK